MEGNTNLLLGVTNVNYPREYYFYIGARNALYTAVSGLI
jgi:hypothetical protein